MPPENHIAGSPVDWLRYALSDLEFARITPPPNVLLEVLCFHTQQAVEKALKAVLIAHGIPVPKTHSIRMLIDLIPQNTKIPEFVQSRNT